MGGKWRQLYLNNNKKNVEKSSSCLCYCCYFCGKPDFACEVVYFMNKYVFLGGKCCWMDKGLATCRRRIREGPG